MSEVANNTHFVSFFRPGQIVFHVAGNADTASLLAWATPIAAQRGAEISVPNPPIKFPPPDQYPDVKKAFLNRYPTETRPEKPPVVAEQQGPFTLVPATVKGFNPNEPNELLDLVLDLDRQRKNDAGNVIEVVTLDWLTSGGPSTPGGTGGPGGKPVEFVGQADTKEHLFHYDSFKEEDRKQFLNGKEGDGVVVVVLDTAPIRDLADIYNDWVTTASPKHALLEEMQINRTLTIDKSIPDVDVPFPDVSPDPLPDARPIPPEYLQTEDHDYLMSDHGLFIAGIIHSLAPKAKIHLIQVLNRYGVGDLTGIATGLEKVVRFHQSNPSQKLLVNMSLTLQLPLEEAHIQTKDPKGRALGMKILSQKRSLFMEVICFLSNLLSRIFHIPALACGPSWFERQALPLLSIIRSVSTLQTDIIAAAGNKGKDGYRPQAEFPAAFPEVLGVGALPKNPNPKPDPKVRMKTARYSNLSDRPKSVGKATLGGEEGLDENKIDKGILGIYVGDFPGPKDSAAPSKPTPSKNGWAYWSGTSFATAVMTGLVASKLSDMPGGTPRDAINALSRAQDYLTEQCEDVLYVTQC